jgi:hypothetical protein
MNIKTLMTIALALANSLTALPASAQNPFEDPASAAIQASPAFKAFLGDYVAAINAKDREKLKACVQPKSQALMSADKTLAENWFKNRFTNPIPADRKVSVTTIAADAELPFAQFGVAFPVRPTNQIQISFNTAPNSQTGVVAFLILEGGKWLEVVPSAPSKK